MMNTKNTEKFYDWYLNSKTSYIEDILWGLLFFSVSLIFTTQTHDQFTLPKLVALRFCTLFLVLFLVYRLKKGMVKALPKSVLYPGLTLCLWWTLSFFFAFHKPTALHGAYGRYNGLWHHLLFLLLFFLAASMPMNMKRLERILKLFVLALTPVSLYAILQAFKIDQVHWYSFERPGSSIGQPIILAALAGLAVPFSLMFFFYKKGKIKKIFWLIISLMFLIVIIITLSRGVWIATLISLFIFSLLVIKIKNLPLKKIFVLMMGCVILLSGLVFLYLKNSPAFIKRLKSFTELKGEIAVQSRIYYYDVALKAIKAYPLFGVGFENFSIVYPKYRSPGKNPEETEIFRNILPTKVHNGYLQMALTSGIPSLMVYLVLLASILILLKKTYKKFPGKITRFICAAFFVSIIGYLIQDISGWNEIGLTAFSWIILGFSVSFCNISNEYRENLKFNRFSRYIFSIILIIFTVLLSVEGVKKLYANKLFQESRYLDIKTEWERIESNTVKGLSAVYGDFFYEYAAALLYEKRFGVTGDLDSYEKGCRLLESAHKVNPYDPYILIKRIEFDIEALKKGIIKSTSKFVRENIKKPVETAKNNPTVYEVIAKLRFGEKKFNEALEYIRKVIELREENIKYYLIEGDIYRMLNDLDASIDSYKKSISNNSDQKVFREEWIHAKYGIAAGLIRKNEFDEALKEIYEVTKYFPGKVDTYLIMGDIYGRMNNLEKARESFEKALEMDPLNHTAKRGLQQIERILGSRHSFK